MVVKYVKSYGKGMEDTNFSYLTDSVENPKQREMLEKWVRERNANKLNRNGTRQNLYFLIKYGNDNAKYSFLEIPKEVNVKYCNERSLKKTNRKSLIYFLKWCNGGKEIPDNIDFLDIKEKVSEVAEERDPLTEAEVKKLIENTSNLRDKTIIAILADTFPLRSIELRNLKTKDVIFDDNGVILKIASKSKSGKRQIRLINSLPLFKSYWQGFNFKHEQEHAVFFSLAPNSYEQPLKWTAISIILERTRKRAGIKRKIKSHDFRKYVATKLLTNPNFTNEEIKKAGGWSSLNMLDRYSKVTSKMVTDKVGLLANGEKEKVKEDLMKPKTCLHCGEINAFDADYCSKCYKPISAKAFKEEEKKAAEKEKEIQQMRQDMLDIKKLLAAKSL